MQINLSDLIKFIKLSHKIIAPVLTNIFNKCIKSGVFPQSLKSAEIVPIFKKGDRTKESNYRPISLFSPFSEIFERHIYNNIYTFITKHNLLHKYQYGFREGSSTELALANLSEKLAFFPSYLF